MIISKSLIKTPLPILHKYHLFQTNKLERLTKYHRLCYSVIIPHATTDLIMINNNICLINYLSTLFCFNFYNRHIKFIFLFLYSIFHIRNDIHGLMSIKFLYSMFIHGTWICFPEFSLSYLAWVHSLLHYKKVLPYLSKFDVVSLMTLGIITYFALDSKDYSEYTNQGYWIPFMIGHIINIS